MNREEAAFIVAGLWLALALCGIAVALALFA